MKPRDYLFLVAWILAFEAISGAIGMATAADIKEWYGTLARPFFSPPNYVFPIIWPALYALISAAGWRIFSLGDISTKRRLGGLFAAYMALNWSWSFIFFSMHMLFTGFVWILLLDVCAMLLIFRAWRLDRYVSYLMLPSLAWTLFAAVLNGAYWFLNR